MPLDPRTPVLVGCAQITQRAEDLDSALEPLALMEAAARAAAVDAGAPGLLDHIDSIRIPHGIWRYGNAAHRLAERLGCTGCETGIGPISGSTVQIMLSRGALEIQAGQRDVVLLASAEAEHSRRRARRAGRKLPAWAEFGGFDPLDGSDGTPPPDQRFEGDEAKLGWWESHYRVRAMQAFALYENEMRHQRGETLAEHRARIAQLWERLARVAADNAHAWIRRAPSASEIATPSESNRMLAYPYTKLMVANMVVDQGAALLLCSHERAERMGVPADKRVYPLASAEATKTHEISQRPDLHSQPAIGLVGRKAFELAGTHADEIDHVDLYSCFPSAVQMAANELGFSQDRDLTVTGGLTFSGGPLNSYVMHSIAGSMNRLRAGSSGERALVSSIGGFIAKHAVAIYSSEPPPEVGFQHARVDDAAGALPQRDFRAEFSGEGVIETFTVMPDKAGAPDHLLLSCNVDQGARAWAVCRDRSTLAALEQEELCGQRVRIATDGAATLI